MLILLLLATVMHCMALSPSVYVRCRNTHNHINPYSLGTRETPLSRVGIIVDEQRTIACRKHSNTAMSAAFSAMAVPHQLSIVRSAIGTFYRSAPTLASFLTASILACAADIVAQIIDECTTKLEKRRILAMTLYSGLVSGVCVEYMYSSIFPLIFGVTEGGLRRALRMTLLDECVNAPLLWLPPAYIAQAVVYQTSKREAIVKYLTDVRDHGLLKKYWSLWIPMSIINFSIVPLHFRVAFVAVVSFFWMIILSVVANRKDYAGGDDAAKEKLCDVESPRRR